MRGRTICLRTICLAAVLVVVAAALGATSARAATLASQVKTCERELGEARVDLAAARAALRDALTARQRRGTGLLVLQVAKARHAVEFWAGALRGLRARQASEQAERAATRAATRGDWRTVIGPVARANGVSAEGLYQLMMLESGGRAKAVSQGRFFGLFQYSLGTWRGHWNPWREASVFDGVAQIKATALAVRKGMGRSLWASTYGAAF